MTCQASSKPESGNSTATMGFEAAIRMNVVGPVPPKPAQHDSKNIIPKSNSQVVSGVGDSYANLVLVQQFIHHLTPHGMASFAFANCLLVAGYSNHCGDCYARSASSKLETKPQSIARQHDIRRSLIEADLACLALAA